MTAPVYTLDHVRAALNLTDEQADKVRDYTPPPLVSPELRLARECAAAGYTRTGRAGLASVALDGDGDDYAATIAALLALQRRHELDTPAQPPASHQGYVDVFYELAKLLGIGADTRSPSEVWSQDMLPRLCQVLGK